VFRRISTLVPDSFVPLCEGAFCWYYRIGDAIRPQPHVPPLPPARLRYQVGSVRAADFVAIGEQCVRDLQRGVALAGADFAALRSVLDFGCGCGRTLRWLTRWVDPTCRLYGTDMNADAIEWCRTVLAGVQLSINRPDPPLDYPDETFDLVYALSVFTHLTEAAQLAWLAELRRIAKPGGIVLMSVLGEACWAPLAADEIASIERTGIYVSPSRTLNEMYRGRYTHTFNTPAYIRNRWSGLFTVLHQIPQGVNKHQDLVVLRRPI